MHLKPWVTSGRVPENAQARMTIQEIESMSFKNSVFEGNVTVDKSGILRVVWPGCGRKISKPVFVSQRICSFCGLVYISLFPKYAYRPL
jgi:hypothetical protein